MEIIKILSTSYICTCKLKRPNANYSENDDDDNDDGNNNKNNSACDSVLNL